MFRFTKAALAAATALALIAGGASFAQAQMMGQEKTVMVGGLSEQTSVRRNFEDEFLTQLKAAGVDVLPSYRYVPDDEKIDDAKG